MNSALKRRTKGDEIFNSISHGVGIALAVAATVLLVVRASLYGTAWHIVSFSIFGVGMILLYTSSTIFHGVYNPRLKYKLNKLDHSSIYVLIAATYTPLTFTVLRGAFGWVIFGIIWGLAIAGVVFKVWFYTSKLRLLSTILYMAMGWMIIIAIVPVIRNTPSPTIWFLLAGCLSYTFAPFFYMWRSRPYLHGVFHIFILGGTICHFFGFWYLL
ncbi:MAG: hemolysin III family protein [Prolixibacteraceae bacterium]|jgi:hemolysin III|nr:hemolysin III family protein [Prolixibacteraceae bacterium]